MDSLCPSSVGAKKTQGKPRVTNLVWPKTVSQRKNNNWKALKCRKRGRLLDLQSRRIRTDHTGC